MLKLDAYWRLMRFHKPIGIILLWIPTAWALWLANPMQPSWSLIFYFFVGTVLMRAAGCVVNDIADRNIDKHVQRTRLRPLTAGEISLQSAVVLLLLLFFAAFLIVLQLPILCFYYALAALFITVLYPFCKRFLHAPQLVLGLAFSMGIPMAYAASNVPTNATLFVLCSINFAWIVAYDTMYAMIDREDDLRIGVKSTAILFGRYDRLIILSLQLFFHGLWLFLPVMSLFYVFWGIGLLILMYQQRLLAHRNVTAYLNAFNSNAWYGLCMWVYFILQNSTGA